MSRKAILLFVMMVIGAGFEALGIGMIMPFLALAANPESLEDFPEWVARAQHVGVSGSQEILILLSSLLLGTYILKNLYLLWMHHLQYKFIYTNFVRLTIRLFTAYLHAPYEFHITQNSADLVRNLTTEITYIFHRVLIPVFTLVIEVLVISVIGLLLMAVEPIITFAAVSILGGVGALFYVLVRKRMLHYGTQQQRHIGRMIQWIHQGVGSIKEAKVRRKEDYFVDRFHENSHNYAQAGRLASLLQLTPRFFIETLSVGGILLLVLFMLLRGQSIVEMLPTLGVFGLAAVRLMPSMTRLISSLTILRSSVPSLHIVARDLQAYERATSTLKTDVERARMHRSIRIEDVSYTYPGSSQHTIDGLTATIKAGESVAFVGTSGAGKTTTIDLLLGLLEPSAGRICIDGRDIQDDLPAWQTSIGYISQPIYLLDDTIRRNVAFGVDDEASEDEKIWRALEDAQLSEHVLGLPDQLETVIGERGARFSGGQRQRLGIARALYHDPDVLVLDEATSALDNETEREIVKTISRLSGERTVVTIAHRLSTIRDCDQIFFMSQGRVQHAGTFAELLEKSDAFRRMVYVQQQRDPQT